MDRKRILLGEDNLDVQKVTQRRLEHEGFEVITASDGADVLQQATQGLPIHVILLDIRMPKLDGYTVCRTLKQQPATAAIPVIIFSASEFELQRMADRCIEVGASDWIRKPFRSAELLEKIHRALGEEGGRHE